MNSLILHFVNNSILKFCKRKAFTPKSSQPIHAMSSAQAGLSILFHILFYYFCQHRCSSLHPLMHPFSVFRLSAHPSSKSLFLQQLLFVCISKIVFPFFSIFLTNMLVTKKIEFLYFVIFIFFVCLFVIFLFYFLQFKHCLRK